MKGTGKRRMAGMLSVIAAATLTVAACSRGNATSEKPRNSPAIRIGQENTFVVKTDEIRVGPEISGALSARREATVRAEVGGALQQVFAEVGQAVKKGAVLGRIEDRTLIDAVASARSAVTSEKQALATARRERERASALVRGGAIAQREAETAADAVTSAEARLADATSRLVSADKALSDATIISPLAGIVSTRPVNAGDIVSTGDELFRIIDPSSMRLEASVASEALGALRVGGPVTFEVRGYPGQTFRGSIERISPAADPVTRQVSIFVSIPNEAGRLVAGLFAEGRVTQSASTGLVVPLSAIETNVDGASVMRVRDGKSERVAVALGLRDDETERVEVTSGLSEGDVLLVGAGRGVTPGTPVQINGGQRADAQPEARR
ncbi:MAG: efflux RND transporter periplasmic adaptor subunit [Luteitalea sp.]|nr:efflux RND transporter periplasmic adaptor subunit [Luteitalea sp.]